MYSVGGRVGRNLSLRLLTLSHFFNIILQFLHQLLHNVTPLSPSIMHHPLCTLSYPYTLLRFIPSTYTIYYYSYTLPYTPIHSCIILIRIIVVPYGYTFTYIMCIHLCIMYCIGFSYIVLLYYSVRVILYIVGYFTGMCIYL